MCYLLLQVIGCDFVVSATGVQPNPLPATEGVHSTEGPKCTKDGYICVDTTMRTSVAHVFAAGDCCELPLSGMSNVESSQNHFFQLRLWSQVSLASVYSVYAAVCSILYCNIYAYQLQHSSYLSFLVDCLFY